MGNYLIPLLRRSDDDTTAVKSDAMMSLDGIDKLKRNTNNKMSNFYVLNVRILYAENTSRKRYCSIKV